jgi:hypothetical protein
MISMRQEVRKFFARITPVIARLFVDSFRSE